MNSKNSYLDYYKVVLENVKFDTNLFWKEYQKAVQVLSENEKFQLWQWINNQNLN